MNQKNLQQLFAHALHSGIVRHADLMAWLRNVAGIALMGYRANLIKRAVTERVILRSCDPVGHVIYTLPSSLQPCLFDSS